jgi:peroxiredoxin
MKPKPILLGAAFFLILSGTGLAFAGYFLDSIDYTEDKIKAAVAPDIKHLTPLKPGIQVIGGPKIGNYQPYGTLISADGKNVDFETFLRHKATLIIFYQGAWSLASNAQMDKWVKLTPRLQALGYQVAAISPDKPSRLKESFYQHHINYLLFSDPKMDITQQFGLAYHVEDQVLKNQNVNLDDYTGNSIHALPLPAVYGIDQEGIIRFVYLYPNDSFLDHPERLLKAAKDGVEKP